LTLEILPRLLKLGVNVDDTVGEQAGEVTKELVLPLVVLCVNFGLNLLVVDDQVPERPVHAGSVKGLTFLSQFLDQLQPELKIFTEVILNLFKLQVPKGLELQPLVNIGLGIAGSSA
jgi:hypothetical protein